MECASISTWTLVSLTEGLAVAPIESGTGRGWDLCATFKRRSLILEIRNGQVVDIHSFLLHRHMNAHAVDLCDEVEVPGFSKC